MQLYSERKFVRGNYDERYSCLHIIAYLENDPVIKAHIDEILAELGTSKKAKDLETLAFHILTLPEIG